MFKKLVDDVNKVVNDLIVVLKDMFDNLVLFVDL